VFDGTCSPLLYYFRSICNSTSHIALMFLFPFSTGHLLITSPPGRISLEPEHFLSLLRFLLISPFPTLSFCLSCFPYYLPDFNFVILTLLFSYSLLFLFSFQSSRNVRPCLNPSLFFTNFLSNSRSSVSPKVTEIHTNTSLQTNHKKHRPHRLHFFPININYLT
jgi:hypothetical protein